MNRLITLLVLLLAATALVAQPAALPQKGMTWLHSLSNPVFGTITVGCVGCNAYHGDTPCIQKLPLLCIYKNPSAFPVPTGLTYPGSPAAQWAHGVVATTPAIAGNSFAFLKDADKYCVSQFGAGWRTAEFHEGAGWSFQAYGGTVSAPTVPSTRFWVYINDQPAANCWQP